MHPKFIIHSYGTNSKGRTIKGTPDSFLTDGDSMIFVEATIKQDGLFGKLERDIEKCLSLDNKKLKKIILSFTGTLNSSECEKLHNLVQPNIVLELLGIDEIANLIYLNHQYIALDYLNLSIDNGQVLPFEVFMERVDKNKKAPPLNVDFAYRENEIREIEKGLELKDYVVLIGVPGCGKTKLALEVLAREEIRTCYVIKDKQISINEDLIRYFHKGEKYLILIDDANQLSHNFLDNLIDYFSSHFDPGEIKIIITVRDYAKKPLLHKLQTVSSQVLKIDLFTDEEIINIIKNNLKIVNEIFLEQIASVSNGNARIAYMLGQVALEEKSIFAVRNNEQLMQKYYKDMIDLFISDRNLTITFGVMSFFKKLFISRTDILEGISRFANISVNDFKDSLKTLHSMELLDIYHDKLAVVSDETLGNYIFYYIFIENNILDITALIKTYYQEEPDIVFESINSSLSIFQENTKHAINKSALVIFQELVNSSKSDALEFLSRFCPFFEIDAMSFLQLKIKSIPDKNADSIIDFDVKINLFEVKLTNLILISLKTLSNGIYYSEIFELLFSLFKKEGFDQKEILAAIYQAFAIDKESHFSGFLVQKEILKKLENNKDNTFAKALIEIFLMNYIPLYLEETVGERKNVKIYNIIYDGANYYHEFRNLLWMCSSKHADNKVKNEIVNKFLRSVAIYKVSKETVISELSLIKTYLWDVVSNSTTFAIKIEKIIKHHSIECPKIDNFIVNSRRVYIHKLLTKDIFNINTSPNDYEEKNNQLLIDFAKNLDFVDFNFLIDVVTAKKLEDYRAGESLITILSNVTEEYFLQLLNVFLKYDIAILHDPDDIIKRVTSLNIDFLDFINNFPNFSNRQYWMLRYYINLTPTNIGQKTLQNFMALLESYEVESSYGYINTDELIKYHDLDKNFYEKYCLNALVKSDGVYDSFTRILFNSLATPSEKLFSLLNGNLDLYKRLYFRSYHLTTNFDHNFKYAEFICSKDKNYIFEYIKFKTKDKNANRHYRKIEFVWRLKNSREVFEYILNSMIEDASKNTHYYLNYNPLHFLISDNYYVEFFELLKTRIVASNNANEISIISETSLLMPEYHLDLFEVFITTNPNFELFKNFRILPYVDSWSGSGAVYHRKKIDIAKKFVDKIPHSIEYIEYRKHLSEIIEQLAEQVKRWEIEDILNDFR